MTKIGFFLTMAACAGVLLSACAKGSGVLGDPGAGGAGGSGAVTSGDSGSTTVTTSDGTGTGGDDTTTASTGTGGSTSTTTTTTSTSTSTGSGMDCPAGQHFCGGLCAGNTPQTGCSGSVSCSACPAAPLHGALTCSAAGQCDFTCTGNYQKSGNACSCATECCADADCANGSTCQGGTCSAPPPPPCDANACVATCVATCIIQGKLGIGICLPDNTCGCTCL